MCEAIFVTKQGVIRESFAAIDLAFERSKEFTDLLTYRVFQVYGAKKKAKKKDRWEKEEREEVESNRE